MGNVIESMVGGLGMSILSFSANNPDIESAACSHVEERHEDTEKPTLTGLTSVAVMVG